MTPYTWVCWSALQQMHNANRDCRVHMQGHPFGKSSKTLCGVRLGPGWDYECHDYPPSEFRQCRRCQAVYRRFSGK
jgi:hypothetical protein